MSPFGQMPIPFYSTFVARKQQNDEQAYKDLGALNVAQNVFGQIQAQQDAAQLRDIVSQSGGDVEKALAGALKVGNVKAAATLEPLVKLKQAERDRQDTAQALAALYAPGNASTGPTTSTNPMIPGPGASVMAGSGPATPLPAAAQTATARRNETIDRLKQTALRYTGNPAVFASYQKEINRLQDLNDKEAKPTEQWSEPYNLGGATVQRNLSTGQVRTAVTRPPIDQGVPPVTNDTLEMDAYRYLTDGTLPPNMGRGQQGAEQATKIRNRASELAKQAGVPVDEIRMAQLTNKAQVGVILQLGKARAQILQFEKTAEANADLALQASERVDRSGVPVLNRWIQAGRVNVQGDPEASRFHAATETFVNEYAKVMSGGYGAAATTEGAQNRAHTLLNTAQTKEQFRAVVDQLRKEMDNRVGSLNSQMDEERRTLRNGVASPGRQPAAGGASAQPGGSQGQQLPEFRTEAEAAAAARAGKIKSGDRIRIGGQAGKWQ
jgi:protein-tyrosine-phosphatase